MAHLNRKIKEPEAPGAWVDAEKCHTCGETISEFKPGVKWEDGVQIVRQQNGEGGGFRSRGPVLWAMHVQRLQLWFERHAYCWPCLLHD